MGFKMYGMLAALAAVARLRAAKASGGPVDLTGAVTGALHSAAQSSLYLATYSATAHLSQCFVHRHVRSVGCGRGRRVAGVKSADARCVVQVRPRLDPDLWRSHWRKLTAASASVAGLALAIEDAGTRMGTALYTLPQALQGLVNLARKHNTCAPATELPHGQVRHHVGHASGSLPCANAHVRNTHRCGFLRRRMRCWHCAWAAAVRKGWGPQRRLFLASCGRCLLLHSHVLIEHTHWGMYGECTSTVQCLKDRTSGYNRTRHRAQLQLRINNSPSSARCEAWRVVEAALDGPATQPIPTHSTNAPGAQPYMLRSLDHNYRQRPQVGRSYPISKTPSGPSNWETLS